MSAVVVDTSAWVSYLGGRDVPQLDDALRDGRVHLPPIVVAELLSGPMSDRQRGDLLDLLGDLPICDASFEHWVRVGLLRSSLQGRGITISTPDAHIAQCCLDLGAALLTEDKNFKLAGEFIAIHLLK